MNGVELETICKLHNHTAPIFQGVYSADTLPLSVNIRPSFFLVNTDYSYENGKHWVLLFRAQLGCLPWKWR